MALALAVAVLVAAAAVAVVVVVVVRHQDDHRPIATHVSPPPSLSSASGSPSVPGLPSLPPVAPAVAMPPEATDALDLVKRFVVVVNTYGPKDLVGDALPGYEKRVQQLVTPKFYADVKKSASSAGAAVKQQKLTRTATAVGAGVEHDAPGEVTILAGARTSFTYRGNKPVTQVAYYEITAVKQSDGTMRVDSVKTPAQPLTGIPAPTGLAPAGDQAVLAASKAAPEILGYDYRTVSGWRSRVAPLVTPGYLTKFTKLMKLIVQNAPRQRTVVSVKPVALSVASLDVDRVEVVAYLDRPTTSAASRKPVEYHDGVLLTMVRSDGTWLIDGVRSLDQ